MMPMHTIASDSRRNHLQHVCRQCAQGQAQVDFVDERKFRGVCAPIPSASDKTATAVNARDFASCRSAKRRSDSMGGGGYSLIDRPGKSYRETAKAFTMPVDDAPDPAAYDRTQRPDFFDSRPKFFHIMDAPFLV